MGFLSKLFRKKSVDIAVEPTSRTIDNPECIKLLALKAYMNSLLSDNRYTPKSEYRAKLLDEKKIVEYFAVLENSGMLGSFCQTNVVSTYLPKITEAQLTLLKQKFKVVILIANQYVNAAACSKYCRENNMYCDQIDLQGCSSVVEYIEKNSKTLIDKVDEYERILT